MPAGLILNDGTWALAESSFYSQIAQSVEQMTVNHWVGGSSPSLGAKNIEAWQRSGNSLGSYPRDSRFDSYLRNQNTESWASGLCLQS